jgi:hypothetical protein
VLACGTADASSAAMSFARVVARLACCTLLAGCVGPSPIEHDRPMLGEQGYGLGPDNPVPTRLVPLAWRDGATPTDLVGRGDAGREPTVEDLAALVSNAGELSTSIDEAFLYSDGVHVAWVDEHGAIGLVVDPTLLPPSPAIGGAVPAAVPFVGVLTLTDLLFGTAITVAVFNKLNPNWGYRLALWMESVRVRVVSRQPANVISRETIAARRATLCVGQGIVPEAPAFHGVAVIEVCEPVPDVIHASPAVVTGASALRQLWVLNLNPTTPINAGLYPDAYGTPTLVMPVAPGMGFLPYRYPMWRAHDRVSFWVHKGGALFSMTGTELR